MAVSTAFEVTVAGSPLPVDLHPRLVSAVVEDARALPDTFALRFRDPDRSIVAKAGFSIGGAVKVGVHPADADSPVVLLDGEVTALELEFDSSGTFTVVRGYDHSHRLHRGRRSVAYTQVTASDVVATVARRAGLATGTIESTSTVFEHLGQVGESDWQFLHRLAHWAVHDLVVHDGRLDFTRRDEASTADGSNPDGNPLVLQLGTDLLRFRATVTGAQQVDEVEVRGWDPLQKQELTATVRAASASAELAGASPGALSTAFGSATHVDARVPWATQAEADTAARALAEQVAGTFAELRGVVRGNPALRAGTPVTLEGAGEPFDGRYTVTTSRHAYDPENGYTTTISVTGQEDASLRSLAAPLPGPAGSAVVVGLVADVSDPQNSGRVRLRYPWLDAEFVSSWARTVHAGAGKDRGFQVLPEVGDEVLVSFDAGGQPFVLGGLHNGEDTPPSGPVDLVDGGTAAIQRRSLVSRLGHRIDLLDGQSAAGVRIATQDGALLLDLDAVGTRVTVTSDGTVTVSGSKGVVVDAGNSRLDLKGGTLALAAQQGVTIDGGGGAVEVTTGGALKLSGTTAALEGSTTTKVTGGVECAISATLVRIN